MKRNLDSNKIEGKISYMHAYAKEIRHSRTGSGHPLISPATRMDTNVVRELCVIASKKWKSFIQVIIIH